MEMRRILRGLIRAAVMGVAVLVVCSAPITVDLDAPVKPPPLASTLLVIGSSSLLVIAGCTLRQREPARAGRKSLTLDPS